MTGAKEKNIKDILGTDAASQEVAEKAVAEAKKDLDEEMRLRKIKLIKIGSALAFVAIAMVIMTLGWFSMNKETSATSGGVRVDNGVYELRFYGDNVGALSYTKTGENEYTTTDIYGKVTPTTDYAYQLPDGIENVTDYYDTDGSRAKVIMRLNDSYPNDPKKDTGLTPGSEGEIIFWVVPKKDGTFTAKFSFDLIGYTAVQSDSPPFEVTSLSQIPESAPVYEGEGEPTTEHQKEIDLVNSQIQAERYLNTHILFFKGTYNETNSKWDYNSADAFLNDDMLSDGSFSMTFPNVEANHQYEVRIKWIWPNTLKQMLFISGEGEAESVTSNATAIAEVQQYACDNFTALLKGVSDRSLMMTQNSDNSYSFNSTAATTNLDTLSRGYNKADSDIGNNVNYMLLTMVAE